MTFSGWTANQILTLVVAGYAAVVATASAVVGIVAVAQNRAHFGRPNWDSSVGAVWSDPVAVVSWRLENFGPREAMGVTLFVRPPGRMSPAKWIAWRSGREHQGSYRANWVGYVDRVGVQEYVLADVDAATGRGEIVATSADKGNYKSVAEPGEPLYGKWRTRLEWRAAPKSNKVRKTFQSVRIGPRFKKTNVGH